GRQRNQQHNLDGRGKQLGADAQIIDDEQLQDDDRHDRPAREPEVARVPMDCSQMLAHMPSRTVCVSEPKSLPAAMKTPPPCDFRQCPCKFWLRTPLPFPACPPAQQSRSRATIRSFATAVKADRRLAVTSPAPASRARESLPARTVWCRKPSVRADAR